MALAFAKATPACLCRRFWLSGVTAEVVPILKATRSLATAIVLAVLPGLGCADDVVVLATNYDLKLSVDKSYNSRVRSRALVRSGNEIPILLNDFKIGLRIVKTSSKEFLAQAVVYERSESGWYQITIQPLEFAGTLGAPTQYSWESGGMTADLAIVVGVGER